jgi:uncharacterized protein
MRGSRVMWGVLLGIVVSYIAANGALYGMQRQLVFQPWLGGSGRPEAVGMTAIVTTAADGVTVAHWGALSGAARGVVVLFHGNGGTVAELAPWAEAFRRRGYGVVLADYRGYSGNPGSPSEQGLYADARALLAWLGAQGFADRQIVLLGWSLGSGVAVEMAVERHPRALVLLSPYTALFDVGARDYPLFPVRALMRDRFDNLSKIAAVDAPVMIVHGAADDVVPPDMGRTLFAAAREPKRALFVAGVGHAIEPRPAFAAVAAFLDDQAPPATGLPAH